mgnify:CR=1 FL=1
MGKSGKSSDLCKSWLSRKGMGQEERYGRELMIVLLECCNSKKKINK